MPLPLLESDSVVIKEEVFMDDLVLGEEGAATEDPLLMAANVKPEPLETVDCGQEYPTDWNMTDDSNSQSSSLQNENDSSTCPEKGAGSSNINSPSLSYYCLFCPKLYKRRSSLTNHIRSHSMSKPTGATTDSERQSTSSGDNPQTLKCSMCQFVTPSYSEMLTHTQIEHPNALGQQEFLLAKAGEMEENLEPDGTFQCGVCSRVFQEMASFFAHRKLHEEHLCHECGKMTTKSVFHKLTHIGKALHPCLYCEKYFSQKSTLKLHEKLHSSEKCHTCNICNEKFVWLFQLLNHKKNHISQVSDVSSMVEKVKALYSARGHQCRICIQKFENIVKYSKHVKSHYEEEEEDINFKCHICDVSFSDVSQLVHHRKYHR